MEKIALFAVLDRVSGNYESYGCYTNRNVAARVLVATYAFAPNPSVCKRLRDFELVQLTDFFLPCSCDKIERFVENLGSLELIKRNFDRRDMVFELPDENERYYEKENV